MVAEVDFGAHLPLVDFGTRASLPGLKAYAKAAAGLGYRYLCATTISSSPVHGSMEARLGGVLPQSDLRVVAGEEEDGDQR